MNESENRQCHKTKYSFFTLQNITQLKHTFSAGTRKRATTYSTAEKRRVEFLNFGVHTFSVKPMRNVLSFG